MPGWHISSGGGGGGGGGDVVGPAASVSGNIVSFDGLTGKLLQDSGVAAASVVVGPASSTDNAIARWDLATGKLLQNSAVTVADTSGAITTSSNNDWIIKSGGNAGLKVLTSGYLVLVDNSVNTALVGNNGASFGLNLQSGYQFSWSPTAAVNGVADTGVARHAVGVVRSSDGGSGIRGLLGGGAAVASATALPVPTGRVFHVTGTTTITSLVSTNFQSGVVITMVFDDVLTLTDGGNLSLAGDFVTTANDTITLVFDGTSWFECSRSVN